MTENLIAAIGTAGAGNAVIRYLCNVYNIPEWIEKPVTYAVAIAAGFYWGGK